MVEMLTPQDVSRITGLSLETLAQWRSKKIHLPYLKTMRHRPIRPNVYLPVVKFGVMSSDWKFVLGATFVGYTAPFLLDLKLWGVKLELWTGVSAAAFAVAFFNWARIAVGGYNKTHDLNLRGNRINYERAVKAVAQARDATIEATKLREVAAVGSAVDHNNARDMEQGLTLRY